MLKFFRKPDPLEDLRKSRKQCLQHKLSEAAQEHLMEAVPEKNTPVSDLSFLVVDFETTGFEPEKNDIISMGWIEISKQQIDFASSGHIYISNEEQINHQTAVINHIVPQMVREGVSLHDAVNMLLKQSQNKVLVAHGKIIEKSFLDYYANQEFGLPELPLIWVDTLRIEKWRSLEKGINLPQDNRISSERKKYNLPEYAAHNALIDSIATAELLLAQISHCYKNKKAVFEHLYKISQ